ncbi:MAG: phage tail tape measure protein [Oligoflexia bacterium]|nr:phage tail tape measure protein [Oligoflexia bacterium]
MTDSSLIISIGAKADDFTKALKIVESETTKLKDHLKNVAAASATAFVALGAGIGAAVNQFAEFDNKMMAVKTLLNDSSFATQSLGAGFAGMKKDILEVASAVPVGIGGLSKALFDTVSAGISASDSVKMVENASKLAVAGITDVAIATDGMTSALNAYGISADKSEVIASKFFTAQVKGKTTVEELARNFGQVGATASEMGVSLDEVLSSVAAMTLGGTRTAEAFTSLKAVLSNVAKPTKDAAEEAARLGVAFDMQALKAKGLSGFIEDLTTAHGFNAQSVAKLFGSVEAMNMIFSLTGKQSQAFKDSLAQLRDEQGNLITYQRAYTEQSADLSNQMVILKNNISVLAIQIGEFYSPAVTKALSLTNDLVEFFKKHDDLRDFIAGLAGIAVVLSSVAATAATASFAFLKMREIFIATTAVMKSMQLGMMALAGSSGIGLVLIGLSVLFAYGDELPFLEGKFSRFTTKTSNDFKKLGEVIFGVVFSDENSILHSLAALSRMTIGFLMSDTYNMSAGLEDLKKALNIQVEEEKKIIEKSNKEKKEASEALADAEIENFQRKEIALRELSKMSESERNLVNQVFIEGEAKKVKTIIDIEKQAAEEKLKELIDNQNALLLSQQKHGQASIELTRIMGDLTKEEQRLIDDSAKVDAIERIKVREDVERQAAVNKLNQMAEDATLVEMAQLEHGQALAEVTKIAGQMELDEQQYVTEKMKAVEAEKLQNIKERKQKYIAEEFGEQIQAFKALEELQVKHKDTYANLMKIKAEMELAGMKNINDKVLALAASKIESHTQMEADATAKEIATRANADAKFEMDAKKHGKAIATINKVTNAELFKETQNQLKMFSEMQNSHNSTLRTIGKAAAITEIIISTEQAMMSAFMWGCKVAPPPIGAAIGTAAAATAAIWGAERVNKVRAAQKGAFVTEGVEGIDSVPFLLSKYEMVVPRQNYDEHINAIVNQRLNRSALEGRLDNGHASETNNRVSVEINLGEKASRLIAANIAEGRALGLVGDIF